jgi:hypothetical protein
VNDATLAKYIPRREENYDQMQWIAFYKVIMSSSSKAVSVLRNSLIEIKTRSLKWHRILLMRTSEIESIRQSRSVN